MELIEGATLKRQAPLNQALNYSAQIVTPLTLFTKGIPNGDLKPPSILVTKAGPITVIKDVDRLVAQNARFGMASRECVSQKVTLHVRGAAW